MSLLSFSSSSLPIPPFWIFTQSGPTCCTERALAYSLFLLVRFSAPCVLGSCYTPVFAAGGTGLHKHVGRWLFLAAYTTPLLCHLYLCWIGMVFFSVLKHGGMGSCSASVY